jgi:hypothetical protein
MCGIVRGPHSSQHYSSRQMHNLTDFFRMLQNIPVSLRGACTKHTQRSCVGHGRVGSPVDVIIAGCVCTLSSMHCASVPPIPPADPPPTPTPPPFDTPRLSTRVCGVTQQQQMLHSPPSAAHTASQQQSGRQQQQATSALRPSSSSSSRNRDLAG